MILLYKLTLKVGYNEEFAHKTIVLFSISPISIFTFAPYTESMFTFLTLLGCFLWVNRKYALCFVIFFYSCFVRSNGSLLAGFFFYSALLCIFPMFSKVRRLQDCFTPLKNISFNAKIFVFGILGLIILILPTVLITKKANEDFCPGVEWCGSSPYSYIQSKYWNVGFLKFWRKEQIPNILLAMPITFFSIRYLTEAFPPQVFPFAVHLLGLLIFSLLFAHMNVTTRLLLAACPASWWALASYKGKASVIFCSSYFFVGIALFTNFLPWT